MNKGDMVCGFRLESVDDLSEFRSEGRYFTHLKTGCELYHVSNDDPENLFSFIFRTIPENNTGVAHIIEHSVLSGSKNFPLKDPFVQLLKSSMYTFLNAMTYPDKTVYPASSTVEADYFNLMSVYGDAVFFPLLKEAAFLQEGIRIQKNTDGSYKYSGVVYNEMKGNYSDHNSVLAEWSSRSLFPDTSYRFDSGGVPDEIRKLGYKEFKDFHGRYYHPSNCRIFLYGNIATEKQLEYIDRKFLSSFSSTEKCSPVRLQGKLQKPVYLEKYAHSDDGEGTTSITINWLCGDATDPFESLRMEILSELLLGSSGSPLYLSIIDSGLGEDLSPVSGIDTDLRQIIFSAGIRGTSADKREEYEKLVYKCLEETAEKGFDRDLLEGTLRLFEFSNREIKGGRPSGLKLMDMCLSGWLHDCAPSKTLLFSSLMEKIRKNIAIDSRYFEKLLMENIASNEHRTIVTVVPDNGSGGISDNIVPGDDEREKADRDTLLFDEYQAARDSVEDIARIPVLSKNDLPEKIDLIECSEKHDAGLACFVHGFYTAGITYTDIFFDILQLDENLKIYLPLFSRFIRETGLPGVPYYDTAKMLNLKTGGFYVSPEAGMNVAGKPLELLAVHFKSLTSRYEEACEFIFSLLRNADFDDLSRLKDIFREMLNDLKASVVRRGNYTASLYASRNFTPSLARQEDWAGISQLLFLQSINPDDKKELEKVSLMLKKIRDYISCSRKAVTSLTSDESDAEGCYKTLFKYLPRPFGRQGTGGELFPDAEGPEGFLQKQSDFREASFSCIIAPSLVSYNSAVLKSSRTGSDEYVYEKLLSRVIETGFLWDKVRMEGGAYGVGAVANGMEGLFSFSSYRDPQIEETQKTFLDSLKSVTAESVTDGMLLKAVISGVGREIRPLAPGEKGIVNTRRKIYGLDDDLRQRGRDIMLGAGIRDIVNSARMLEDNFRTASKCVLTGRESFDKYSNYFTENQCRRIVLKL